MSTVPKRILKEVQRLNKNPPPGISISVNEKNMRYITVKLQGPTDSPYEGGVFNLEMYMGDDYPMSPPKVRFVTRIYHPNVDKIGRICLDILKDKWTPALQIRSVLLSLQVLMGNPNVDDPLDESVADHWRRNKKDAEREARDWTRAYANN